MEEILWREVIVMRLRKTFALMGLFALLLGIQSLALPNNFLTLNSANAANIDIWWPADGARVSGTQPFKAMLQGRVIQDYNMFWQVDGGQWNFMDSNWQDWPHKEAQVNLSSWSWRGEGSYKINFIATDLSGSKISEQSISLYVEQDASAGSETLQEVSAEGPVINRNKPKKDKNAPEQDAPVAIDTALAPELDAGFNVGVNTGNPFIKPLYVDPNHPAKHYADLWRNSYAHGAAMLDKIASQSGAKWFGGWNGNIFQDVKNYVDTVSGAGALPVMIVYNVPQRDCGSYSAGGAGSPDAYRQWIYDFAAGIGNRHAVVILEPDALSGMDCLSWHDRQIRMSLLKEAVGAFNSQGNTSVYVDAGNPFWQPAPEMANRLREAGVEAARGFALNVSNYFFTQDNVNYGNKISSATGKPFVIDTSRNGNGPTPDKQWCNPLGRALGQPPTTNTGHANIDAFLWLKVPGESDGTCNGGPSAGNFWAEHAVGLAERANW